MKTWEFKELNCATKEYIISYFDQPRFFNQIEYMDNAHEVLSDLIDEGYEICIVSMGTAQNLLGKEIWLKENLPNVKFIGCNLDTYRDKSHIDMSDGILIDDEKRYLDNSNASVRICFGDKYEWNKEWQGIRCYNWYEVKKYLESLEGGS